VDQYNKEHGTAYASYARIHLSRKYPESAGKLEKKDWENFVRTLAGIQYLRIDPSMADKYHLFLEKKYLNIGEFNKMYGTSFKSFSNIPIPEILPFDGVASSDWDSFIAGWKNPADGKIYAAPIEKITLQTTDFLFQDYLKKKFKDITNLNRQLGTSFSSFADILIPQRDMHYAYFVKNKGSIKWEFIRRNYIAVADYIIFHGRAVINTVIYCLLAIMSALIINPLAAYAMSRFKLPSTYKILLFLLCTMAFPPMVTAIPNFLMLRSLGLLNTFAALILPGMANGYAIFLLKGFFDSQPQELYESASLDGASEWVLFWQIAMSLSKPILAVIALQAFNLAYSNFMFAFVVCQDEKMWTLMV
jgi:multiple sugar transport system permease protein